MSFGSNRQRAFGALVVLAALATACGGSSGGSGPLLVENGTVTQVIGFEGGSIAYTASPLFGTVITFPGGALAGKTTVTLGPGTSPKGPYTVLGPVANLGPSGSASRIPFSVKIPYDSSLVPAGQSNELTIYVQDSNGNVSTLGTVSVQSGFLQGNSTIFGTFWAGVPNHADASLSTVDVSATSGVLADGVSTVTVTVEVKDAKGVDVGGEDVVINVSGSGNIITQPSGPSGKDGIATGTIATTVPETKTITITVGSGSHQVTLTASIQIVFAKATAASLSFATVPNIQTAGTSFTVVVDVVDGVGNIATVATDQVTLTLTGPGTLQGAPTQTAQGGIATFQFLQITKIGSYTLTATAPGLNPATSATFQVVPGTPVKLSIAGYPSITAAGVAHNVTVSCEDGFQNPTPTYSGTIHFTSNTAGVVLPADTKLTNGTGQFPVTFTLVGTNFSITATDTVTPTLTATQLPIQVVPGTTTHFTFTNPYPTSVVAGVSNNFGITAFDANNNVATNYTGTVHFTSTNNGAGLPADSTLTNGAGTFSAFMAEAGGPFTLFATDTANGTVSGSQNNISVSAAALNHFNLVVPDATAGVADTFTITARDQFDNLVTGYAGSVSLTSTATAPFALPSPVQLTSGSTTTATGTFQKAETGRTISAKDTVNAAIVGTSNTFAVGPGALNSFGVTLPNGTAYAADQQFPVSVTAFDAFNNVKTNYGGTVHITSNNPNPVLPADAGLTSGVGTFQVTLHKAGIGFLVNAADQTAGIGNDSSPITINPAVTASFQVTGPATTTAGATFQVHVAAIDSFTNVTTGYTSTVNVSSDNSNLSNTFQAPTPLVLGEGDFTVKLCQASVPATLRFSMFADDQAPNGLRGSYGNIQVNDAGPNAIVYTQHFPQTSAAGDPHPVGVAINDAFGNIVLGYSGSVTFSSDNSNGANKLPSAQTLTNGQGTFNVVLAKASFKSSTFFLRADADPTLFVQDDGITINANVEDHLQFQSFPSTQTAGQPIDFSVAVLDSYANLVTGYSGTCNLSIAAAPTPPAGGSLHGQVAVAITNGIAQWTDTEALFLDKEGAYALLAHSDVQPPSDATSTAITITHAAADHLSFLTSPSGTINAGDTLVFDVIALDPFGNLDTGFNSSVTITSTVPLFGTNQNGFTLGHSQFGGVSQPSLNIHKSGNPYMLHADAGITAADSAPFTVGPASTDHLAFTQPAFGAPPFAVVAGVPFDVMLEARDSFENVATSYSGAVSLAPSSGALFFTGSTTGNFSNGIATFAASSEGPNFHAVGSYTLSATSSTFSTVSPSGQIDVSNSPAFSVSFTNGPSAQQAGKGLAFDIAVVDSWGNPALDFTGQVALTINSGPAGATLSGPSTPNASTGSVHYDGSENLFLDKKGTYTLLATAAGVANTGTSGSFTIAGGDPFSVTFTTQPHNAAPDKPIGPVVTQLVDKFGNFTAPTNPGTDTTDLTLTFVSGDATGAIQSTTSVLTASDGSAVFGDASVTFGGSTNVTATYRLHATGSGAPGDSGQFVVSDTNVPVALRFVDGNQPGGSSLAFAAKGIVTANQLMRPPVVAVEFLNAQGGATSQNTNGITVTLTANGATLLGRTSATADNTGRVYFPAIYIGQAGVDRTLTASAQGLTPGDSLAFDVIDPPNWSFASSNFRGGSIRQIRAALSMYDCDTRGFYALGLTQPDVWTEVGRPPLGIGDYQVTAAAIDTATLGGVKPIYVATDTAGYYASPDGGTTWNALDIGGGGTGSSIVCDSSAPTGGVVYFSSGGVVAVTSNANTLSGKPTFAFFNSGLPSDLQLTGMALDSTRKRLYMSFTFNDTSGATSSQDDRVFVASTDDSNLATYMRFSPISNLLNATNEPVSEVLSLAFNEATDTLYVGTLTDDLYRLDNASSGSTSWAHIGTAVGPGGLLGSNEVDAIVVDPNHPTTVYIVNNDSQNGGPGSSHVMKSTDSGATWFASATGISLITATATCIEIDPNAGTNALSGESSTIYVGTDGAGIFRSVNSGGFWAQYSNGIDHGFSDSALGVDPSLPASGGQAVVYATSGNDIYYSTNGGQSWNLPNANNAPKDLLAIQALIGISVDGAHNVYVGSENGVFVSTDNGQTWTLTNNQAGTGIPAGTLTPAVCADPMADTVSALATSSVFVGQLSNNGQLYRSNNGGTTWTTLDSGATGLPSDASVYAIAFDPSDASRQTLYAVIQSSNSGNDVWTSTDGGQTWTTTDAGSSLPPEALSGIDVGQILAVDSNGAVFFATKSGLYTYDTLNGWSGDQLPPFLQGGRVRAVAVGPTNQVFATADMPNSGAPFSPTYVLRADGQYAVFYDVTTGLETQTRNLAVDMTDGSGATIYAGTKAGVYKTTNGGGTGVQLDGGS